MLTLRHNMRGFSLIELIVGMLVLAILVSVGAPSFMTWIQNSQLRTAAESISAGVQLARAEAVRRNTAVRFQLTSNIDATCVLSTTGNNWVVSMDNPTGLCNNNATADDAAPVAPRIIQKHSGAEGTSKAVVNADISTVSFTGLGRASNAMTIQITNPTGGTCQNVGGPMRCLNVMVSAGGQILMCNPAFVRSANPQGC